MNTIYSTFYTLKCPYPIFGYVYIIDFFKKLTYHLELLNSKKSIIYNNFKVVFENSSFTCIIAIEHNVQHLLYFEMSISQLWLCVHNWNSPQVYISFNVVQMEIINDIQQILSCFLIKLNEILTCWKIQLCKHNQSWDMDILKCNKYCILCSIALI